MAQRKNAQSFYLNAEGLERVLGPLEADLMNILWDKNQVTVREVQEILLCKKEISFNTVMTVMNRLVDKGLVIREEGVRSSLFSAAQSRDVFLQKVSRDVTTGLVKDFGSYAVAQFVDLLHEVNPKLIEELEKKLAEHKTREKSN